MRAAHPHQPASVPDAPAPATAVRAGCRTHRRALRSAGGGPRGHGSARPKLVAFPGRRYPGHAPGGTRSSQRRVVVRVPVWVAELAGAFWKEVGVAEPFPRNLRGPITHALPLAVVYLSGLCLT